MSDVIIPEEQLMPSDVVEEAVETVEEQSAQAPEQTMNLAEKTLAELVELFQQLGEGLERIKKSKEAEAIKSAFYKRLSKEKAEAGLTSAVDEPDENTPAESSEGAESPKENDKISPFEAIEAGFKSLYMEYKKERAEINRQQEEEREANYEKKLSIIEDLRKLVDAQEDINATFPDFRGIQNRWKETGPVPAQKNRDINDQYHFLVEKFYDKVKINHDLRDLDFKKNLEAKESFIAAAEKLAENENVIEAFHDLQKLHEQWKEFGPVAKEKRDEVWDRFKAATAVINRKYQSHFEEQKVKQADNLKAKAALCEQVEAIAEKDVQSSNEFNALSKEIEEIQKQWKSIGFASKKDNQKIYDRFRAACDKFFEKKRVYYAEIKDNLSGNLDKKMALIETAESLKTSTDWKATTDRFIELQKEWKAIGAVPRKKSEQLWKRFRAACDAFFEERDKQAKPAENDYYGNLKAKRRLIEEINAYEVSEDEEANSEAMKAFSARWQELGFVPFKEKEAIGQAYKDAMNAKFPRQPRQPRQNGTRAPRSEKDVLLQKFHSLQQDIANYENNIGFFAMSKNSEPLIRQMQDRIDSAKQELKELEEKIRNVAEQ